MHEETHLQLEFAGDIQREGGWKIRAEIAQEWDGYTWAKLGDVSWLGSHGWLAGWICLGLGVCELKGASQAKQASHGYCGCWALSLLGLAAADLDLRP